MLTNFYKTIKRHERPPLRIVELYYKHSHVIWVNQLLDLHCTVPLKVFILNCFYKEQKNYHSYRQA